MGKISENLEKKTVEVAPNPSAETTCSILVYLTSPL
jgi:hypothetical protein